MAFMSRSLLTVRALVVGAFVAVFGVANAQLYFNDLFHPDFSFGAIRRVNTDGSQLAELVNTGGGLRGLAVDLVGGKMYWADVIDLHIKRANLDGTGQEDLIQLQGGEEPAFPSAIAVHHPSGKIYWGDQILGTMNRANLDGSDWEVLFSTPFHRGLAIDDINGKLYWDTSLADIKGEIWRCNLDGTGREISVTSLSSFFKPNKLALDIPGGKIYWTDYVVDVVQRSNLDGSNIETLYVPPFNRNPQGIALDLQNGIVYWGQDIEIDGSMGKIMTMGLDGSNAQDFLFGFGHVTEVVLAGIGSTETLAPFAETINSGKDSGGNLGSWAANDNDERVVCKFIIPNQNAPFAVVTLDYTTTHDTPTAIRFKVKVTTHTPGPEAISLYMIDQTNGALIPTDVVMVPIVSGTTYTGNAAAPLGRYIGAGHKVSGRIVIKQTGPAAANPCIAFEFGQLVVSG